MARPMANPIRGAKKINNTVLPIPDQSNAMGPLATKAAPIIPPINAWEELVGRPQYQVIRFHMQAAISVAAINALSTIKGSMIPFPIMPATFRGKIRKATKLKKAAQITALYGLNTRVETMVATELAAS